MKTLREMFHVALLLALLPAVVLAVPAMSLAADPTVNLGTASSYAVLAASTITNTGSSAINGDVGVYAGTAITGFPPGTVSGTQHADDAAAAQAQIDLGTAYDTAAGLPTTVNLTGQDLGGLTLTPGVYNFDTSAQLTGDLTLNAQGDPNALFVFKIGSTLTTASSSRVLLENGARFGQIFWQVGSSATLGTGTQFVGRILAMVSITANTGATVQGQLLARTGAVTLDTNAIDNPATLHVIKHVINAGGGTASAGDFTLHVELGGTDVAGSPASGAETPGTAYTLAAGTYAVSENASATYAASYSGGSDASGTITLAPGDNKTVTITNTYLATPVVSLNITKAVRNMSGTVLRTGSVLRWTIVVTNFGNVSATNVVVSDTVPVHSTYVKKSITGLGHDDSHVPVLLWNVGTIGVGNSVTLTFESSVNSNVANGTIISNRAWVQANQSPSKSATAQSGKVSETTTKVVRTSGDEDVTLGLMGLLAALALGFAWHGRSDRGPAGKRGTRITVALLLSAALALGGMEVGAASGLPVPSPGEIITSAVQTVMASTNGPAVAATVATARVVGRVRIPSIGVNQRLVEGSTMSALSKGLWRQPPSAEPGTSGACVIAGHRISTEFSRLSRIKVGAPVWVTVGRKTYKYRVSSVFTGGSTLSFRTGATEKLILYTCLPRWQGNRRTVVVCYRTSS
jgi:LPXTG-site transpeptidase (sortase) family protein